MMTILNKLKDLYLKLFHGAIDLVIFIVLKMTHKEIDKEGFTRFVTFAVVGVINTVVDISLFFILKNLGVYFLVAQIIASSIAIINSYFMNKSFTFKKRGKSTCIEIIKYFLVNGTTALIVLGVLYVCSGLLNIPVDVTKICIMPPISIIMNYFGSKLVVFNVDSKEKV